MMLASMKTFQTFFSGIAVIALTAFSNVETNAANFTGKWITTATLPDGETRESSLTVSKKDGNLQATLIGQTGDERVLDRVKTEGKTLTIEFDFERDGNTGIIGAKASLNQQGALIGKWYVQDGNGTETASEDWQAVRSAAAVLKGKWNVVAETTENDIKHAMVIKKNGASFTGYAESDEGQLDYTSVKADKNVLKLELPYGGGTVKVEATLKQARKLEGKWIYLDEFKDEVADGNWSATKERPTQKKVLQKKD